MAISMKDFIISQIINHHELRNKTQGLNTFCVTNFYLAWIFIKKKDGYTAPNSFLRMIERWLNCTPNFFLSKDRKMVKLQPIVFSAFLIDLQSFCANGRKIGICKLGGQNRLFRPGIAGYFPS